jgi:hypothetical protein
MCIWAIRMQFGSFVKIGVTQGTLVRLGVHDEYGGIGAAAKRKEAVSVFVASLNSCAESFVDAGRRTGSSLLSLPEGLGAESRPNHDSAAERHQQDRLSDGRLCGAERSEGAVWNAIVFGCRHVASSFRRGCQWFRKGHALGQQRWGACLCWNCSRLSLLER